jgi:hypothetical protein
LTSLRAGFARGENSRSGSAEDEDSVEDEGKPSAR